MLDDRRVTGSDPGSAPGSVPAAVAFASDCGFVGVAWTAERVDPVRNTLAAIAGVVDAA